MAVAIWWTKKQGNAAFFGYKLLVYGMPYKDPEKRRECARRWYAAHPTYHKDYYAAHPESDAARREYVRQWQRAHPRKGRKDYGGPLRKRMRELVDSCKVAMQCQNPACPCAKPLPAFCLDYHHIEAKSFNLGSATKKSRKLLLAEMAKCTVLCAICHRQEEYGDIDASGFPRCIVSRED